ncbi:MAG: chemotaxis protein CheR [Cyanobacteria bacterium 13_1_40CM_2_61_4]|nr:MAG: chemotaxis protein CheR [Cyanobacteria bacterium 13_1_40CM_2_61_4]
MLATQQVLSTEDIEIDLLLEGIFRQYGFDFRKYARSSLRRRVRNFIRDEQIGSVSLLQDRVLHDPQWLDRFVYSLSVNVSPMFRDAHFYVTFRREVVPLLRTYPFSRIWVAGVSTGEELYSLAIVLEEEGIHDRCRIYATDINDAILKKAKDGIYPLDLIKSYTNNYVKAGGKKLFSDYYTVACERGIMKSSLRDNIVFAQHNLASDASFNEFHAILCRNVMIYFNSELQAHVFNLLDESLVMFGVIGLGARETIKLSPHEDAYEEIDKNARLYRRIA